MSRSRSAPELPAQRSTESFGLGQSGYTAGRREGDPALETAIEASNRAYPRGGGDRPPELGLDERWTGRGGSQWSPEPPSRAQEAEPQPAAHPRQRRSA